MRKQVDQLEEEKAIKEAKLAELKKTHEILQIERLLKKDEELQCQLCKKKKELLEMQRANEISALARRQHELKAVLNNNLDIATALLRNYLCLTWILPLYL